jgi:hypothetical protein
MLREKAQAEAPGGRKYRCAGQGGLDCSVVEVKQVTAVKRREQVTRVVIDQSQQATGNRKNSLISAEFGSLRWVARAVISREAYVRICERRGVQFPGPTRLLAEWRRVTPCCPGNAARKTAEGRAQPMRQSVERSQAGICSLPAGSKQWLHFLGYTQGMAAEESRQANS